jgi:hypothetical protein
LILVFVDAEDAHRTVIKKMVLLKNPTPKETREISDEFLAKTVTFAAFAKAIGLSTETETV